MKCVALTPMLTITYYGLFAPLEFTKIIASLEGEPRKKIADKCRRLNREMKGVIRSRDSIVSESQKSLLQS